MLFQSELQRITQHLPSPIIALGTNLLGQECFTTLIYNVDPSAACLSLALSKLLGIGIIIFGSILKIPQIHKIIKHRSARGISLSMYSLEVIAYAISLAYAYRKEMPFSTYGENASLTLQNMIITLLIIYYTPKTNQQQGGIISQLNMGGKGHLTKQRQSNNIRVVTLAGASMVIASIYLFFLCPPSFLSVLQGFSIPISLISKVPQIIELHRSKEPGQLSALVVFAQLAGSMARVYTTMIETGDWLLGIGFGSASVLNAVIAIQVSSFYLVILRKVLTEIQCNACSICTTGME